MGAPDVVVVGGGVIGCAIARLLASSSLAVTVVERGDRPAEASWAAAGMLSPLAESDHPGPFLDLLLAAATRFPALAASLLDETGVDIGYRSEGTVLLALDDADERVLEARWRWQSDAGLPIERLTAAETRALEPEVADAVRWSLRFPLDHQVDSREMSRALWRSAEAAGARFVTRREVESIERAGDRAVGVRLRDGEIIGAGAVVVAAGSWAGSLSGLPRPLPVHPVHGQLIALDGRGLDVGHVIDTPRIYLVPRLGGRIIAGATVERTGFAKAVTEAGVAALHGAAAEAVPALAGREVIESWSGLRPGTPDDFPIVGPDPGVANLFYATGHFRNGILLAPITGEAVAAMVTGGSAPAELALFGIERFGEGPTSLSSSRGTR